VWCRCVLSRGWGFCRVQFGGAIGCGLMVWGVGAVCGGLCGRSLGGVVYVGLRATVAGAGYCDLSVGGCGLLFWEYER